MHTVWRTCLRVAILFSEALFYRISTAVFQQKATPAPSVHLEPCPHREGLPQDADYQMRRGRRWGRR